MTEEKTVHPVQISVTPSHEATGQVDTQQSLSAAKLIWQKRKTPASKARLALGGPSRGVLDVRRPEAVPSGGRPERLKARPEAVWAKKP